ncbi:hypothetical protein D3C85_905210 [compost metagenome]
MGGLHRVAGLQVADTGGVVADIQVIGQAVAVVQAEDVAEPTGVEIEQGRLHPFVTGWADTAVVVFFPVELAVANGGTAVFDKTAGIRVDDHGATHQPCKK